MERNQSTIMLGKPHRSNPAGAVLLTCLGIAIMAVGGYGLGRFVFAKKFLKPSEVHQSRASAVRILSPTEARTVASDKPSPVWTRGVTDDDIPKSELPKVAKPKPKAKTKAPDGIPAAKPGTPDVGTVDTTPAMPATPDIGAPPSGEAIPND